MKNAKPTLRAARRKLGSRAGETIAETLVAVLIAAVAILMLASMLSSSADLIRRSDQNYSAYYAWNNSLTAHDSAAKVSTAAQVALTESISGGGRNPVALSGSASSVPVDYYSNAKAPGSTPVIAYCSP